MNERDRRIGQNEILMREVNDRIEELGQRSSTSTLPTFDFLCECGDPSCSEHIWLTQAEYESVRANAHHFITRLGHEAPGVEAVVEQHEHYQIVAKDHGEPKELAEATDPR